MLLYLATSNVLLSRLEDKQDPVSYVTFTFGLLFYFSLTAFSRGLPCDCMSKELKWLNKPYLRNREGQDEFNTVRWSSIQDPFIPNVVPIHKLPRFIHQTIFSLTKIPSPFNYRKKNCK